MSDQFALFDAGRGPLPDLPPGFHYRPDLIGRDDEAALLDDLRALPFREFDFHGYKGKRRVVSFGWKYDFSARELQRVDDIPPFLFPLRANAAGFAGVPPADLQHVLITEYAPGAGIGWHRDKPEFGIVVGISLLSACAFRLRRRIPGQNAWQRVTITAEPRSVYLLSGAARTEWEHSIPGVDALRYSVTFRNLRVN